MELYNQVSYELAEKLTRRYSTSFSMSSRLFDKSIRRHVYAIYGMVRLADEVVDTFEGVNVEQDLDEFYHQVIKAIDSRYSTNPILNAFAVTANEFSIGSSLINPFFASMRTDLTKKSFDESAYKTYIHGSAEVVGLMCLRVFVGNDEASYRQLAPGASHLGAAYQKVNFLRDFAEDHQLLGRVYFPGVEFDTFSESDKQAIVEDIRNDFMIARVAIDSLPRNSKTAVGLSYAYYQKLLDNITASSVETIKNQRVRIPDIQKMLLLLKAKAAKAK